jgi:hypothetical protein
MTAYLVNVSGPVSLLLDLQIKHGRFGNSSDPSLNEHLHYPNDLDGTLNKIVNDKIRQYRADYNNRPSNVMSFMSDIVSTNNIRHKGHNVRGTIIIVSTVLSYIVWTKLSFCFGEFITLFQLFHTPCKVRKLSSHQRNSNKGSFVQTPLSTTLSISHFHKSKSFSFRFLQY